MKCIVFVIILVLFSNNLFSQSNEEFDKLIKKDNTSINCKILGVNATTIEIDPEGEKPFLILPRESVKSIKYKDGTVVNFLNNDSKLTEKPEVSLSNVDDLLLIDKRDGKKYRTIKVGNQIWMAENLNYKSESGSICYNGYDFNGDKYGRLYTWETAKNVCPEGWRLPSKDDFIKLLDTYGGEGKESYVELRRNNNDGFKGLLGGYYKNNSYDNIEVSGFYWSSTKYINDKAFALLFFSQMIKTVMIVENVKEGFSVRCLKD